MTIQRSCDGCSKCCEGWVSGKAYQYDFYASKPCHFLCNGCTIYEDRPEDPCKSYKCAWLESDELPMWMRPDLSNAIVTRRFNEKIEYYDLIETGEKLDSVVLSWFIMWALNNRKNLMYTIQGGRNRIGSPEFLEITL